MDQTKVERRVIEPIKFPKPGTLDEVLFTGGLTLVQEMSREELKRRYPDAKLPDESQPGQ